MNKIKSLLSNILSRTVSLDLHKVFGDLDRFIISVEKKGKRLVVKVSDPTVLFVLRKMESKVKAEFPDVDEVNFLLSK